MVDIKKFIVTSNYSISQIFYKTEEDIELVEAIERRFEVLEVDQITRENIKNLIL